MRILHLTLHRRWFDDIAEGRKPEEYRSKKPYWKKRLFDEDGNPIIFDEVHFRNGYAKNAPFMRVEWKGIRDAEFNGEDCYGIKLGRVLELRNYHAIWLAPSLKGGVAA